MYAEIMKSCIVVLFFIFVVIRLIRPAKDSSGKMRSWTLTFMQISAMAIFATVFIDTLQDAPQTSSYSMSASATKTGRKVRRKGKNQASGGYHRAVLKEKYAILFALFGVFAMLYLLSHKNDKMTNMGVRLLMAIRGKHNPLPHEEPLEQAMVDNLLRYQDSEYHQEWFLRAMLAKQGTATATTTEQPSAPQFQPMDDDN